MRWVACCLLATIIATGSAPAMATAIDLGPCLIPTPTKVGIDLGRHEVVAGDAVFVNVVGSPGSTPASAVIHVPWMHVVALPDKGGLSAWVPVPLATAVGEHALTVRAVLDDGRRSVLEVPIRVVERDAPVRHLTATPSMIALTTDSGRIGRDREAIRSAYAQTARESLWTGPFLTPSSGRVSTEFGVRRLTNGRLTGFHYGIDIAAPTGTPVLAAHHGRVVLAADLLLQGKTVIIDHGRGIHTLYYHLSSIAVAVGDPIRQGDLVGEIGSTGYSTGPHLHWGLAAGSIAVDPEPFILGESKPDPRPLALNDRR